MTSPTEPVFDTVRRLDSPEARTLAELSAVLEDLQNVLRCCEWLMTRLQPLSAGGAAAGDGTDVADELPDDAYLVEAAWTSALICYGRCFFPRPGLSLTDADLTAAQPQGEVLSWHKALLRLRDHYAHPSANPREAFSVGVASDQDGTPTGVAVTSMRQPMVDITTVRQTGAIAYALGLLLEERVLAAQTVLQDALPQLGQDDLAKLDVMTLAPN